jgi:hypothetical protein
MSKTKEAKPATRTFGCEFDKGLSVQHPSFAAQQISCLLEAVEEGDLKQIAACYIRVTRALGGQSFRRHHMY